MAERGVTLAKRPTTAFIDLEALRHNYTQLKEKVGKDVKTLAVVKANAYGHGAVEVVRVLEDMGCEMFGVALCEEGIELREAG
ncbi:MAG: alanine racemase, partial [Deltaproteobacteria bacterium]|nr:alanine racemase [Deltaproteobacteria bacterium]